MKSTLSLFILAFIYMASLMVYTPAYADAESENAILARINHELSSLEPLINEAEKQQPAYSRVHFDFSQLRADIRKIKTGIQQQLENADVEPRAVEPIKGDYIQVESLKP